MNRRLTSLLLVLAMILTLLPIQAFAADTAKPVNTANPFEDVKQGSWYYDAVQYVHANGLFYGTSKTTFEPGGYMTRGMFVTVLGRMAGVNPDNYTGPSRFSDVPEDAYYAPYVAWAAKYGVTAGTGGGKFSPNVHINRQQMAAFFVRYFEAFDVDYKTGANVTTTPADLDSAAPWAREAILKLWREKLLSGDGGNFDPQGKATRAQAASVCCRTDQAVDTWYSEPGVPSTRVKVEAPAQSEEQPPTSSGGYVSNYYSVAFYDGSRHIDTLYAVKNQPLGKVPAVEKSSKAGAILLGYYTDAACTTPFYAEEPVTHNMRVYARYQNMGSTETLNFTTFTQMDQAPDLSFRIRRTSGSVAAKNAAVLTVKDGSAPVELIVTESGGVCTVSAKDGFNEGCSYELALAEGWVFDGKPDTIRTASFSISKEEVDNMRLGRGVKYLEDTDDINYTVNRETYDVLTSDLLAEAGGSFTYDGEPALRRDDILCVYVGKHPEQRTADDGKALLDPAVYVKVSGISGNAVTFEPLGQDDQAKLYDVPDNFPLLVDELPAEGSGTANIGALDISMYENMMGKDDGNLDYAREHIDKGDFVTLCAGDINSEDDVYFGEITGYDAASGAITYTRTTRQAILDSMELYQHIDLDGDDLLTPEQQEEIVEQVQEQLDNSGFGEQAADLLAGLVTSTDQFRNDATLQKFLSPQMAAALATPRVGLSARDGLTLDEGSRKVTARLITRGEDLHFKGGIQIAVDVAAKYNAPIGNSLSNTLSIDLTGTFVQEVYVRPTINGGLVYKEILGFIPVPIGVEVGASVDVKNYTALSFDAEISTHDNSGILYSTHIVSDLKDMMSASGETGLSTEYQSSLDALMAKYSEMLFQETDWITLVEEEFLKNAEVGIKAIGIGISGAFVVKSDMSIAIGSNLEYEAGKRFNFWFRVGLFKPTAGSDTMDLIDESFAFRFYVMGKLGVRVGVKMMLYMQIGSGALAKVGVSADVGPYLKLYGFFIYEVSKYRPKGTDKWNYSQQMAGALYLELGIYVTLGFEASALKIFEYSQDFLDKEFPVYHAGEEKYFYGFAYKPMEDESVVVRDDDANADNGVSMVLPDRVRELSYMTLTTGMRGSTALPLDRYHFTVSNPNFTYDAATGAVSVEVPENTHFMECDLTVTYLHGKMAFSTYDMSVTVPLVWTDLSDRELQEYFTASVRVGNDTDGYETVWSRKVLRGQPFDLPASDEIKALINYSSAKYSRASGYASGQRLEGLTIYTDTVYDYKVSYQTYSLTVKDIQNKDGSTRSETFDARYGQAFDFSSLRNTGTGISGEKYTKFTNVTADDVNLYRPINGTMAQWLSRGGSATANYVDDSAAAVFTFSGVTHDDVTVTTRKGTRPNEAEVMEVIKAIQNTDNTVGIKGITPELGPIDRSTNYVVSCVELSGARADVSFDMNFGEDDAQGSERPEPVSKLVGSLLVNLPGAPEVWRVGYDFDGWYTAEVKQPETPDVPEDNDGTGDNDGAEDPAPPEGAGIEDPALPEGGGEAENIQPQAEPEGSDEPAPQPAIKLDKRAETQTVPADGVTLYAGWIPKTYTVSFHTNGGGSAPDDITVTHDREYGELPRAKYPGKRFLGWQTSDGTPIMNTSTVTITEDTTLYAQWGDLISVDPSWFDFGNREEYTYLYESGTKWARYAAFDYRPSRSETITDPLTGEAVPLPEKSDFVLTYVGTSGNTDSTENPANAGIYKVRVKRNADDTYAAFEREYADVLLINKATRDLSGVEIDTGNSLRGFNYLSVGTTVEDLGQGAQVSFDMTLDSTSGVTTSDGKCFFYDLGRDVQYTARLTYVSVTKDPNYYDASGSVNASASIWTTGAPYGSWRDHAGGLTANIYTAEQMAALMVELQNGNQCAGKTFTLQNDIDMSAYTWNTAGKIFNGTFDGNGHAIYGLYCDQSGSGDVGLFGGIGSQGTVKNVLLAGGYIRGANRVGGIAGYGHDGAVINNCVNYATISAVGGGETDAGGIIGCVSSSQNNSGTRVINCVNYGGVSGSGYHTGGIMGYQLGKSAIANCANYGSVYGAWDCVGGIAGENYNDRSEVYNCVNGGSVTGSNGYRGAIVGRNNKDDGEVHQCYYLAGSAPNRTATGTSNGANGDGDKVKCSAFSSYTGVPDRVVEDGCNSSMSLMQVLDHWANRCGSEYYDWVWSNSVLVPRNVPKL